jgi:hypothetical protein
MYLVIGSNKVFGIIQNRLIEDFNLTPSEIINPQVYNFKLNYLSINQLDKLFCDYKSILVSSLNIIDIVKQHIINSSNKVDYFVMGKSSYIELQQYTKNKIYYPINQTGYLALFNEILVSKLYATKINRSNLLILSSNNSLQDGMISLFTEYFYDVRFLDLYIMEYNFEIIDQYIDKVSHIVINSSSMIKPFFNYLQTKSFNYSNRLKFITYHLKIKNILELDYKINHLIYFDH